MADNTKYDVVVQETATTFGSQDSDSSHPVFEHREGRFNWTSLQWHEHVVEEYRQERALIREISAQIPFLAHGLTERIAKNGLSGKVAVHGVAGEDWGIGVSKKNPRKDIPNVVIYPRSILKQERPVVNAQLRHTIAHLNHSLDEELRRLKAGCEISGESFELLSPLINAVQTASIDYLEMQNSVLQDPAEAFRPYYQSVMDAYALAGKIGKGRPYKQAIDLVLLHSLASAGLVAPDLAVFAERHALPEVVAAFTPELLEDIHTAVRTSSPRVKVELIHNRIWPALSGFVSVEEYARLEFRDIDDGEFGEVGQAHGSRALTVGEERQLARARKTLTRELRRSLSEQERRLTELSEIARKRDLYTKEKAERDAAQAEADELRKLLDELQDPSLVDENEEVDWLEFRIDEVGPKDALRTERQLEILAKIRLFAKRLTILYAKATRKLMRAYQRRNPNLTDDMIERFCRHHHDTLSFVIAWDKGREDVILHYLTMQGFEVFGGFLLAVKLPHVISRFRRRGGGGAGARLVPPGAIEWGHFHFSLMPAIWNAALFSRENGLVLVRFDSDGDLDGTDCCAIFDVTTTTSKVRYDDDRQDGQDDREPELGHDEEEQEDSLEGFGPDTSGYGEGEPTNKEANADGDGSSSKGETHKGGGNTTGVTQEEIGNKRKKGAGGKTEGSGGIGDYTEIEDLLGQLRDLDSMLESSFDHATGEALQVVEVEEEGTDREVRSIENLEAVKEQQRRTVEQMYKNKSGLIGGALERYIDYCEDTRALTDDLVDFFTRKFRLDIQYTTLKNQHHGARLQRDWTHKLFGINDNDLPVIEPSIFERRLVPRKPKFIWSIIIDNSLSCSGTVLEEEIKTTIALERAAKMLEIPIEILSYGGEDGFVFLKSFDQELVGAELANLVRLNADQVTPDVVTLNAACSSLLDYADRFDHSYNFVYFMTDGASGEGNIRDVISTYRRYISITGIGLALAAHHIKDSWGKSAIAVEEVNELSTRLLQRIEDQVEEMLDDEN